MKNTTLLKLNYFHALLSVVVLAGFSSCSSSQNASSDGIYGPSSQKEEIVMVKDNQAGYYQNYFSQERQEVDEIITDIDNYNSYQEDTDTIYVDDEYDQGKAPWSYSDTQVTVHIGVGFGGYWGWGSPCFGWGYGYAGYGWGYPCGGWGYPGYGWGYPGYGWGYPGYGWGYPGWGWGYPPYWGGYPPYNGRYTYGKRYASNYGRFNTANVYGNRNSLSNRYYRSSDYNRRVQSRDYRSSYPSNSGNKSNYNRSSRNNNRNYQPNNRSYNKSNNRSYTPRNSSPAPRARSSSPSMSRGSSMGRSSGRRNLSYSNIRADQRNNRPAYAGTIRGTNTTNRTFVKRSDAQREAKATRVKATKAAAALPR
jgi:hypothetical protein